MATKICEVCGKPFESNYKRAIYCSTKCRTKGESWKSQEQYRKRTGKPITDDHKKPKICAICGKVITKGNRTKYCSKTCANKAKFQNAPSKKVLRKKNETLCWTCQNACGGCSWSRNFEPVEGWEATPTKLNIYVKEGNDYLNSSFFVISCPQYIPDEPREVKK